MVENLQDVLCISFLISYLKQSCGEMLKGEVQQFVH